MADQTLITYVRDLSYSISLDYFAEVEEIAKYRYECVSVLGQVEAVRSGAGVGILHDFVAQRFSDIQGTPDMISTIHIERCLFSF